MAELGAVLLPLLVLGAPALGVLLLVLPWIFGASLSERSVAAIARICNGAALLGVLILVVARLLDLAPGTLPIGPQVAVEDHRNGCCSTGRAWRARCSAPR